jgi:thiol-disulfide isomerase/thioredoxin
VITTEQHDRQPAESRWLGWLRRMSPRRRLGYAALAAAVLVVALLVATLATGSGKPRPAEPLAKNFSLTELGHPGARLALTAYAGRPVIINFFASWCAPCQRETPMLARFYASAHGSVVLLGIDSNDQANAALAFMRKARVRYPVGFDPYPASTTTSYGVYALPQTFFLNAAHRIVSHIVGPVTIKDLRAGIMLMDRGRAGSTGGPAT